MEILFISSFILGYKAKDNIDFRKYINEFLICKGAFMKIYTQEKLQGAIKTVSSTINNCEKMQHKFKEGTSQHSLLNNRIKALKISKYLLESDRNIDMYSNDELEKALPPVISIINKTEKARSKYREDSNQYKRLTPLIEAMYISKELIEKEIKEKN